MLTSKNGETAADCPIAAAVIRGMQSNPEDEKAWIPSNAPFQVGADPVTLEVLRSMETRQHRVLSEFVPEPKSSCTFRMCRYL